MLFLCMAYMPKWPQWLHMVAFQQINRPFFFPPNKKMEVNDACNFSNLYPKLNPSWLCIYICILCISTHIKQKLYQFGLVLSVSCIQNLFRIWNYQGILGQIKFCKIYLGLDSPWTVIPSAMLFISSLVCMCL